jgi:LCP family protein required for cell wall assembly
MNRNRIFDLSVLSICGIAAMAALILNLQSPVAQSLTRGERLWGLLIGSDYEDNARHSDTLMVVSYEPQTRFLDVLSIPRDTMVSIPELPYVHRINEVFTYEFRHSGKNFTIASLALKGVVETLLSSGTAQTVDLPNFFTIDYQGFRALIDAIGGITIHVTEPMNYDDNWGHLHIHFEKGVQWMNGRQALEYVRFRGKSADSGRVLRQQLFVKELLKQIKNPQLLWRFPQYGQKVWSGFHTSFSAWDLFTLMLEARHMKTSNIRPFALPGQPNGQLWRMNPESTGQILALMKAPPPHARHWLRHTASSEDLNRRSAEGLAMAPTVEVWNASNQPNAARYVTNLLRSHGFDVVKYGPFTTRQQRTLVIDRSGKLRPAQQVAQVFQGMEPDVVSRVDLGRQVDVWVIIGNDFVIPEQ